MQYMSFNVLGSRIVRVGTTGWHATGYTLYASQSRFTWLHVTSPKRQ